VPSFLRANPWNLETANFITPLLGAFAIKLVTVFSPLPQTLPSDITKIELVPSTAVVPKIGSGSGIFSCPSELLPHPKTLPSVVLAKK